MKKYSKRRKKQCPNQNLIKNRKMTLNLELTMKVNVKLSSTKRKEKISQIRVAITSHASTVAI